MPALATNTEADQLEAVAARESSAVSQALQGVAPDALNAYAASHGAAAQMRSIAGAQALAIAEAIEAAGRLMAAGLPEASRSKLAEANRLRASAEAALAEMSQEAFSYISITEATLKASVVPSAAKDGATRKMHRDEIDRATTPPGFGAVSALAQLTTTADDGLTSEAMSDYSIRRLTAGLGQRDAVEIVAAFRATALAGLLAQPRNKQIAGGIAALARARGAVAAEREAAKIRISR